MAIVIFGDSITNRANDDVGGGWTSRLWSKIYQEFPEAYAPGVVCSKHSVIELGIGGDTILGIEKRFETELRTRVDVNNSGNYKEVIVGVAVGVNDSRKIGKSKQSFISNEEFKESYKRVLNKLNEKNVDTFVVGLTPCDEEKVNPCRWIEESESYTNDSINEFNDGARDVAIANGAQFVEILSPFNEIIAVEGPDELLSDGVHPNSRGHQLISNLVYDSIKSKL